MTQVEHNEILRLKEVMQGKRMSISEMYKAWEFKRYMGRLHKKQIEKEMKQGFKTIDIVSPFPEVKKVEVPCRGCGDIVIRTSESMGRNAKCPKCKKQRQRVYEDKWKKGKDVDNKKEGQKEPIKQGDFRTSNPLGKI